MQRIKKPVVPGEVVDANVQSRNMSYRAFAAQINIHETILRNIVNDKARIKPRWAVALEKLTGIDACQWLIWQAKWDLWKYQEKFMGDGYECGMCRRSVRKCECEELKGDSNDAKGKPDGSTKNDS